MNSDAKISIRTTPDGPWRDISHLITVPWTAYIYGPWQWQEDLLKDQSHDSRADESQEKKRSPSAGSTRAGAGDVEIGGPLRERYRDNAGSDLGGAGRG